MCVRHRKAQVVLEPITVVVSAPDRHGAEDRAHRFAPGVDEGRGVARATGDPDPAIAAPVGVEEPLQQDAPHLVHRGPDGRLGGLQVQMPVPLAVLQDARDQAVYFAGRLLANRRRNCFLSALNACGSSTARIGRRSHSASLTATSSVQSRTKAR